MGVIKELGVIRVLTPVLRYQGGYEFTEETFYFDHYFCLDGYRFVIGKQRGGPRVIKEASTGATAYTPEFEGTDDKKLLAGFFRRLHNDHRCIGEIINRYNLITQQEIPIWVIL